MAKLKIKIGEKTVEFAKDAQLCVVTMITFTGKEGSEWPHKGPNVINDHNYSIQPLTLEPGISLVSAASFAAHAGGPQLGGYVESKQVRVFIDVAAAHRAIDMRPLLEIVKLSRHGRALRKLRDVEQESKRPRRAIREAIAERLLGYNDHEPASFMTVADMGLKKLNSQAPQVSAGASV